MVKNGGSLFGLLACNKIEIVAREELFLDRVELTSWLADMCGSKEDVPSPEDHRGTGRRLVACAVDPQQGRNQPATAHSTKRDSLGNCGADQGAIMVLSHREAIDRTLVSPVEAFADSVGNSKLFDDGAARGGKGHVGGSGFWRSLFNGTNVFMALGILFLPYTMRLSGWVGLILLGLVAVMTIYITIYTPKKKLWEVSHPDKSVPGGKPGNLRSFCPEDSQN